MWLTPDLSGLSRRSSNRRAVGRGRRRRDRNEDRERDGNGNGGDSVRWSQPAPATATRRGSDSSGYLYTDRAAHGDRGGSYMRVTSYGSSEGSGIAASTEFGGGSSTGGRGGGLLRRRSPPTLTVILSRLEACLPTYCEMLSTPTVPNMGSAARVLEDSLHPPTVLVPPINNADSSGALQPPIGSVDSSPRNCTYDDETTAAQQARSSTSPSSPLSNLGLWAKKKIPSKLSSMTASPYYLNGADLKRGGGGGGGADPALEAEWNRMVNPLMMLAGAEGLYGALTHLVPAETSTPNAAASMQLGTAAATRKRSRNKREGARKDHTSLSAEPKPTVQSSMLSSPPRPTLSPGAEKIWSMYGKIKDDLIIVKELLCDPLLGSSLPQAPLLTPAAGSSAQGGEVKAQPMLLIPPSHTPQTVSDEKEEEGQQQQTQTKSEPLLAAESLAQSISVLTALCDARRDLICIHADLVLLGDDDGRAIDEETPSHVFGLADRCDAILNSLPEASREGGKDTTMKSDVDGDDNHSSPVRSMIEAMRHEIKATASALRAMGYLETCSFFETILQVKLLKVNLGPASPFHSEPPCCLEMWLRHILSGILSLMNIYYDRIDAYGSSTYGFQKHIMVEDKGQDSTKRPATASAVLPPSPQSSPRSHDMVSHLSRKTEWYGPVIDLDTEVIELLHCHEDRNGAPLAVALVCNSKDCLKPTFERGFTVDGSSAAHAPSSASQLVSDASTGEASWSAIFLRTSTTSGDPDYELRHSGAPGSAAGTLRRGPRKSASKGMSMSGLSQLLTSGGEMASQGLSSIKRPSYAGNTSRGSMISISSEQSLGLESDIGSLSPSPVVKAAEYGYGHLNTTIERLSWPHSEMAALVAMLQDDEGEAHGISSPKHANVYGVSGATSDPFDTPRRPTLLNPFFPPPLIEESAEDGSGSAASPVRSVIAASPSSPLNTLQHTASSYHFVQVSQAMWLSIMIKGEDDERRLLRKSRGLADDEILSWISQFAAKLRPSSFYCQKSVNSVVDARKESTELALPVPAIETSKEIRWKEAETNEFIGSLREAVGLKPSSPLTAPLKSPYIRKGSKRFGSSRRLVPKQQQQDDVSAVAFFVGADLGRML